MPLWAKIYIMLFLLFAVSNFGYCIYVKIRPLLVVYDFFSAVFTMLVMISYWRFAVMENLTVFHALIFFFVIGFEFYLTALGGYEKLGLKPPPELEDINPDTVYVLSLLFLAPAYIVGGAAMFEILRKTLSF